MEEIDQKMTPLLRRIYQSAPNIRLPSIARQVEKRTTLYEKTTLYERTMH